MKVLSSLFFLLFSLISFSQTIIEVDNEKVDVDEFMRVYLKNNNSPTKFSEDELMEYSNLYVLYKMKLKEAEALHLDTITNLKNDYEKYTDQLAENLVMNNDMEDRLMRNEYDRMKSDIKIAHILVKSGNNAKPSDTLIAYNKILYIKDKLTSENFGQMARENSEDAGSAEKGGEIGYITALMTASNFEDAAYNTPVGSVSEITKTEFGYHIIKVLDKRPARGKIKVAHIYTNGPDAEGQINEAYKALTKKKTPFEEVVREYSQDRSTQATDGVLPVFGISEMIKDFEDQCFALKNPGDISSPFKTSFGWHIVKLIEKIPVGSFEDEKGNIKAKLEKSNAFKGVKEATFNQLTAKYQLKVNEDNFDVFMSKIPDSFFSSAWFMKTNSNENNINLMTINSKAYSVADFKNYVNENYSQARSRNAEEFMEVLFKNFRERKLWDITKNELSKTNPEYNNMERDYKNGLLIFELMDREIWKKSVQDSTVTKNIYESSKNNFKYNQRLRIEMIVTPDPKFTPIIYKEVGTQPTILKAYENLKKTIDTNRMIMVQDVYEKGSNNWVDEVKTGVNVPFTVKDNQHDAFCIGKVLEIMPEGIKPYEEVKGKIQSIYQSELEEKLNSRLKSKYQYKIYTEELKKLVKN